MADTLPENEYNQEVDSAERMENTTGQRGKSDTGTTPIRSAEDMGNPDALGTPVMTSQATEISTNGGIQNTVADAENDAADIKKEGAHNEDGQRYDHYIAKA